MHTDPVCKMQIDAEDVVATLNHNGTDYYFCSEECADEFRRNPQQFTKAA